MSARLRIWRMQVRGLPGRPLSACGGVWSSLPALEAGDRWFKSTHADHHVALETAYRPNSRCLRRTDKQPPKENVMRADPYRERARELAVEAGLDPDAKIDRPGQRPMPLW